VDPRDFLLVARQLGRELQGEDRRPDVVEPAARVRADDLRVGHCVPPLSVVAASDPADVLQRGRNPPRCVAILCVGCQDRLQAHDALVDGLKLDVVRLGVGVMLQREDRGADQIEAVA
jgi:hypothetical protein